MLVLFKQAEKTEEKVVFLLKRTPDANWGPFGERISPLLKVLRDLSDSIDASARFFSDQGYPPVVL